MTSPSNPLSFPQNGKLDLDENSEQFLDEDVIILRSQTQQTFQSATEDNKGMSEILEYNLDHKSGSKYDDETPQQIHSQGKNSRQNSLHSYEAPLSQILEEPPSKEDQSISISTLTGISSSKRKNNQTTTQKSDNNLKRSHSTEV